MTIQIRRQKMPAKISAMKPGRPRPGLYLLIGLLVGLVLVLPPAALAKPKAADLVTDGQPIDLNQAKYQKLFGELEKEYQFTPAELEEIFSGQTISRRVLELMDKQWEARPYYKYAPLFLTPGKISKGKEKLRQYRELLDQIEERFGVDREIVIAIWGIETRYGEFLGGFNVLRTLNTLFAAYPRRSAFFRKQLVHFLLLCRENGVDPRTVKGSYAGAFGQTQFIPSSFRAYAVSFDGDTRRDVWNSVPDVLASIANYLKTFGWKLDAPIYAELGPELKSQKLLSAYLKGRKAKLPLEEVEKLQQLDLPPCPGPCKVTIVGLELPPGSKNTMRYIAGYPNFQAITAWNHSNRYAMAVTELAEAFKK